MNRVVVTGMGIVSSLGANKSEVLDSLKSAKSGIEFSEKYMEMGLRSQVHGSIPEIDSGLVLLPTRPRLPRASAVRPAPPAPQDAAPQDLP